MKKIFILMIPALMACTIQASAQKRNIDLTANLTSPVNNDVINPGQQFNITTRIKNLGPDTLTQNDNVVMSLSFNGSPILFGNPGVAYIDMPAPYLEPSDSAQSNFQFTIGNNWKTGPDTICIKMLLKNRTDTLVDGDTLNNESCVIVNIEHPSSVEGVSSSMGNVNVYPNPVSDVANFRLTLNKTSDIELVVSDITGRVVIREQRSKLSGKQEVKVNTSTLSSGTYLYRVSTSDDVQTGKLIVR